MSGTAGFNKTNPKRYARRLLHTLSSPGLISSQGIFLLGATTQNSTTFAAAASHLALTSDVAAVIAVIFKAVFPHIYKQYREAFKAGVWFPDDKGPMLARAIIYKLQGLLHTDNNDVGPSISFGVGKYTGGHMKMPQLGTKFAYVSLKSAFHSSI